MYLAPLLDVLIPSLCPFGSYCILWDLDKRKIQDVFFIGLFFDLIYNKLGYHLFFFFLFFFLFKRVKMKNKYIKNSFLFIIYFFLTYYIFSFNKEIFLFPFFFGLFVLLFYGYASDKL